MNRVHELMLELQDVVSTLETYPPGSDQHNSLMMRARELVRRIETAQVNPDAEEVLVAGKPSRPVSTGYFEARDGYHPGYSEAADEVHDGFRAAADEVPAEYRHGVVAPPEAPREQELPHVRNVPVSQIPIVNKNPGSVNGPPPSVNAGPGSVKETPGPRPRAGRPVPIPQFRDPEQAQRFVRAGVGLASLGLKKLMKHLWKG